jgi:predicted nucleic acid-binding protein
MRARQHSYIETSLLLSALLEDDPVALAALRDAPNPVTSMLTVAEARRGLRRARADGRISEAAEVQCLHHLTALFEAWVLVRVTDDVLERAGAPFELEPVRTLDAIHLATAQLLGPPSDVLVLTRDDRLRRNAAAMGFAVV